MENIKLLVYSDCYIYGGSEKLMAFLLKNDIINTNYNLSFAYRKHKDYEDGLRNEKLMGGDKTYGLRLLSNETLFYKINNLALPIIVKSALKGPFYILEKLYVHSVWNLIVFILFLLKTKPDIIHVNNGGYPGAKSCNMLVVANYLTIRSKVLYQVNNQALKTKDYLAYRFDMFINKNVSAFINASLKAKEQLVLQRKFNEKKIIVIDNCVPLKKVIRSRFEICKELNISNNSFILTNVAFLSDRKGQQYLIKAVRLLLNEYPMLKNKLYLLLVGNGENEIILKELVSQENLADNIIFMGYRNDSEDFIAAADVFVLPSISDEDMPLVLLSALGIGRPIIATDFAGISQVIQTGINGILVNNDRETLTKALCDNIYNLYRDEELRKKLSFNAKSSYAKYTPENYGKKLNEIYKSIYAN